MIKINDTIPDAHVKYIKNGEVIELNLLDYLKGKKVIIFAVPGAFTPTCSNAHLPSFLKDYDAYKQKGIDEIICLAVNDAFVLKAWGQQAKVDSKINFIADGNGDLTKSMGMILDATSFGMGIRSQRYSMYVDSGKVKILNFEPSTGACKISDSRTLLEAL